ncbi:tetratricopeptide repeat protein [Thalassotalea sp. G2M2-11]|uniref:tetratricopeptide repeat protein n=1 Tax=Thalassotalea sp. G2M2-11 TaxID=2787627 RepID=UPI0019D1255B|nr:tetratricopeptide repeat protein [Thalassotalea sp. G2M2-11]
MLRLFYCRMTRWLIVVSSLLLVACQSTSTVQNSIPVNDSLYLDHEFPNYQAQAIESEHDVFAIDDEMKEMVRSKLLVVRENKRRAKRLLDHIFSKKNIDLIYESSANLTAQEAYHSQVANCMSLTIMAYALAKEAGLDVRFQDVKVPEYWIRNGEYNLLTGHVNLVITEPKSPHKLIALGKNLLQIDFDPAMARNRFPKKTVNKDTVLAMFYNNKGADALVDKQYSRAYAYFKQATQLAPSFSPAWGNLGILYKLTANYTEAEKAYQYAIAIDQDNLTAMGNLAFLLKSLGKIEQADDLHQVIHNKRITNPYYHALLGDEAFFRGNNDLALHHYKTALRMNRKIHEFHYGIAKVYYELGQIDKAEKAMQRAISYNDGALVESQYVAKLNFFKESSVQ